MNPRNKASKIFTLKRYKDTQIILINNQVIKWNNKDDSVNYLGVFLDEKLKWKMHLNKNHCQGYTRMNS